MAVDYAGFARGSQFPMDKIMNAANLGLKLRAMRQQKEQQAAQVAQQEAWNTYIDSGRTQADYDALVKANPQNVQLFKQNYENMTAVRQDTMRTNALQLRKALEMENPALAEELVATRKEAAENSGDAQQAKVLDSMLKLIRGGEQDKVKGMVDFTLSTILSPEDAGKHLLGTDPSSAETWKPATPEQKTQYGYTGDKPLMVSSRGDVKFGPSDIDPAVAETWKPATPEQRVKYGYTGEKPLMVSSRGDLKTVPTDKSDTGHETWKPATPEEKKKYGYTGDRPLLVSSRGDIKTGPVEDRGTLSEKLDEIMRSE